MLDKYAIQLTNVSKVYRLYESQRDQIIDILGLQYFGIKLKGAFKEFAALDSVCLDVPRGHRVGIIGRNGAGKTTLLKLLCGNFSCTGGRVEVNGEVQALMNVGLGFHPEYTGRENVEASLQYSGLDKNDYKEAIDGIIDFCELGDFLDQPFKSYSLGMQARLMFAAATAIRPDILIVDEVLGAGDAYFVAKSKARVEKLIKSGCTMLLVSHSMQQVLELCDEAIWLDAGRIRMQGNAFEVVKAYEEFVYGNDRGQKPIFSVIDENFEDKSANLKFTSTGEIKMQEPHFQPNTTKVFFQELTQLECPSFHFIAPGGISRWESIRGIKVIGFVIMNERGINNRLTSLQPAKFILTCKLEIPGPIVCRYGLIIHDANGNCISRIWSPINSVDGEECDLYQVDIVLNPLQFGPGEYVVGVSIIAGGPLEQVNQMERYDLLSRSFKFSVGLPDSLVTTESSFYHSAEWSFNKRVA